MNRPGEAHHDLPAPDRTALAVELTVGALAQAHRTGIAPTPRDAVQTRAEVVERVQTMFSQMDSNRDGALTRNERL